MKVSLQVLAVVALTPVAAFLAVPSSKNHHLRQHHGLTRSFVAKDPPPLFGAYAKVQLLLLHLCVCVSSSQCSSHHILP